MNYETNEPIPIRIHVCTICNESLNKPKKGYKIGYEIDGKDYCLFCGGVLRNSVA